MQRIKPLDPHVADLIAAGEVVERPGAAVKELVENAIDADATRITVRIEHGGMKAIRVTDNGSGINEADVKTAFLRHATSKIRSEFDLEAIGTLGFRGEALAAIAAVSHVELLTRTSEAQIGVFLKLEGGIPGEPVPRGCPQGTSVLIQDLFYNTPARMKFMKKDLAEGLYAGGLMQKIALSRPDIAIQFFREGKEEFGTPGDGRLESAVYSVLGRDMLMGLRAVKGSWDGISVEGFISLPTQCKGTRGQQHFFINGRAIRSRTLSAALEEAYRNRKMTGKFPACVLHVRVKPGTVDVNVHPTKAEVKFANERLLFQAVYETTRAALEEDQTRIQISVSSNSKSGQTAADLGAAPPAPLDRGEASEPGVSPGTPLQQAGNPHQAVSARSSISDEQDATWNEVADGIRVPYQTGQRGEAVPIVLPIPSELVYGKKTAPAGENSGFLSAGPKVGQWGEKTEEADGPSQTAELQAEPSEIELPQRPSKVASRWEDAVPKPLQQKASKPEQEKETAAAPWHLVGEAFDTYAIVAQGQKLLLIDKHAAHERILFDKLKAEGYTPMIQRLVTPVVWSPKGEEGDVLLQHLDLLSKLGFEAEDFGNGSLVVRGIPFDLDVGQTENTLSGLAEALLQSGRLDPKEARNQLLSTMACKMAVKGGEKSAPKELQELISAVVSGAVQYCPHGRPVSVELTRKELEKQFRRT